MSLKGTWILAFSLLGLTISPGVAELLQATTEPLSTPILFGTMIVFAAIGYITFDLLVLTVTNRQEVGKEDTNVE